ncbi:MAG: glycosyltransferase [Bacteroidales bacterium]
MKVLIIYSGNAGRISPFIKEQADAIFLNGINVSFFPIVGKGVLGYLGNLFKLRKKIKIEKPDIIHAHFGLSGLLATLQKLTPVVVTFHGTDISNKQNRKYSIFADKLSKYSIFVSDKLSKSIHSRNYSILPCGVDLNVFKLVDQIVARTELGLSNEFVYILFASSFDNSIKNYPLASSAIELLNNPRIKLLELKNYNRQQVGLLFNAVNCALLTSFSEGSPQFIKEAMACNCPIVSTDVGDVKDNLLGLDGCYITTYDSQDVADKIQLSLNFAKRTDGRNRIIQLGLDSDSIANKLVGIYKQVIYA